MLLYASEKAKFVKKHTEYDKSGRTYKIAAKKIR